MKNLTAIPGLALCLLLTACTTDSINPLSSPDSAQPDHQLVGIWRGRNDPDKETFRISITNTHWMHVIITPDQTDTEKRPSMIDRKPESYDFFPTVIGNNTFLNVVTTGKDDAGHPTKTYQILRYTVKGNHELQMWMISQDAAAAAVRAGKLQGHVDQGKDPMMVGQPPHPDVDVTLHSSSADLVKFIQGTDVKALFSDKMETLYRVSPPGK